MNSPYRILRFKPDADRITIRFASKEARDEGAQKWADKDHYIVGTEEYCRPGEENKLDWWLDGVVVPTNCAHDNTTTKYREFPAGPSFMERICSDCGASWRDGEGDQEVGNRLALLEAQVAKLQEQARVEE